MRRLKRVALFILGVTIGGADASTQEFDRLGTFSDVRVAKSEEPHCYGRSLTLWKHRATLIGLLNVHNGLCGDPACGALRNLSFDPGTGVLSFASGVGATYVFEGKLRRDDLIGVLNGQRVRLPRRPEDDTKIDADRTLAGWCEFWSSVPRCGGVKELCASLHEP